MNGQEIPEEFKRITSETGWWSSPDDDVWFWRLKPVNDEAYVLVEWRAGRWWVVFDSDDSVDMELRELMVFVSQMRRVYDALGLDAEAEVDAWIQTVEELWGTDDHDCDREYRKDCARCNGVNPGDVGTW